MQHLSKMFVLRAFDNCSHISRRTGRFDTVMARAGIELKTFRLSWDTHTRITQHHLFQEFEWQWKVNSPKLQTLYIMHMHEIKATKMKLERKWNWNIYSHDTLDKASANTLLLSLICLILISHSWDNKHYPVSLKFYVKSWGGCDL